MIARASGFRMRVGRFSRPLSGVGVLAMPDVGLDATRHIGSLCEVPQGTGVLRLLVPCMAVGVPGMVVGVLIDCRYAADGMETRCWAISATRELFSKDEWV